MLTSTLLVICFFIIFSHESILGICQVSQDRFPSLAENLLLYFSKLSPKLFLTHLKHIKPVVAVLQHIGSVLLLWLLAICTECVEFVCIMWQELLTMGNSHWTAASPRSLFWFSGQENWSESQLAAVLGKTTTVNYIPRSKLLGVNIMKCDVAFCK